MFGFKLINVYRDYNYDENSVKEEKNNNPELKIKRQKHTVIPFPVGLGGGELSKLWFQG